MFYKDKYKEFVYWLYQDSNVFREMNECIIMLHQCCINIHPTVFPFRSLVWETSGKICVTTTNSWPATSILRVHSTHPSCSASKNSWRWLIPHNATEFHCKMATQFLFDIPRKATVSAKCLFLFLFFKQNCFMWSEADNLTLEKVSSPWSV